MLKHQQMEKKMSFGQRLLQAVREASVYGVILLGSMLVIEIYGLVRSVQLYGEPKYFFRVIGSGILNDLSFGLNMAIFPAGIFILLSLFNNRIARLFFI